MVYEILNDWINKMCYLVLYFSKKRKHTLFYLNKNIKKTISELNKHRIHLEYNIIKLKKLKARNEIRKCGFWKNFFVKEKLKCFINWFQAQLFVWNRIKNIILMLNFFCLDRFLPFKQNNESNYIGLSFALWFVFFSLKLNKTISRIKKTQFYTIILMIILPPVILINCYKLFNSQRFTKYTWKNRTKQKYGIEEIKKRKCDRIWFWLIITIWMLDC